MPSPLPLPSITELVEQLAAQIRPHVSPTTVLVGIHRGGVWVAEALHDKLGIRTPPASLDISFHRDDHHLGNGLKAGGRASQLPDAVEGAHLILVDDVIHTGRTIRAALNEIFDYGRPSKVELAVLVDRDGRELPIAPAYCPHRIALPADQNLELQRAAGGELSFRVSQR